MVNLKNLFKFFFNKLINRTHLVNKISVKNKSIQFASLHIIDLEKKWVFKNQKAQLISYEGDSTFSDSNNYPIIETWAQVDNKTYAPTNFHLKNQFKFIKKAKTKKKVFLDKNLFMLPYYTSHFGHFIGDTLGSILYYLRNIDEISEKNKLLVISPSLKWDNFISEFGKEKIELMTPKIALNTNYDLNNCKILPRMCTYQNYILANNILANEIKKNSSLNDKIFLTTEREDRISNIKILIKVLKDNGFKILNPKNESIKDLLILIKSAKILISEKSSIGGNIHIVRDMPYYVLSSPTENNFSQGVFEGAGMYRQFHTCLEHKILCENDPSDNNRNFKPNHYRLKLMNAKRIRVDMDKINKLMKSL